MCIIVVKPKKVEFPEKRTLRNCFSNNPDGAGFMYVDNNEVVIDKGYMSFRKFWKGYRRKNLSQDQTVIFHFRIGTSGQSTCEFCHPFPLTFDRLAQTALNLRCDMGLVHNGIIGSLGNTFSSDTMEYITTILSDPYIKYNLRDSKTIQSLIKNDIGHSKFAILYPDDNYVLINEEKFDEYKDCLYSNYTYMYNNNSYGYDSIVKYTPKQATMLDNDDWFGANEFDVSSPHRIANVDALNETCEACIDSHKDCETCEEWEAMKQQFAKEDEYAEYCV